MEQNGIFCKMHFQQFFTEKTLSSMREKLCSCPKD